MSLIPEYQALTAGTAIYPEAGSGSQLARAYVLAGLLSECGELYLSQTYEDRLKEFGDVLWYLARLCEETKHLSFEELVKVYVPNNYDVISTSMIIGLSKIADIIKKSIRDGDPRDYERKYANKLNMEYGLVTVFSTAFSFMVFSEDDRAGVTTGADLIEKALELNVKKLTSRKDRNKLGGSGDER